MAFSIDQFFRAPQLCSPSPLPNRAGGFITLLINYQITPNNLHYPQQEIDAQEKNLEKLVQNKNDLILRRKALKLKMDEQKLVFSGRVSFRFYGDMQKH